MQFAEEQIADVFARAGCQGRLHAAALDGSAEIGVGADDPVTPASTIKVLVAIEAASRFADGRLDGARPVRLGPDRRTVGPVGLSLFADESTMSARDLLVLMLTISDNVATDCLIDLVGVEALNETASRLGMKATHLPSDLRTMLDEVAVAAGFSSYAEVDALEVSDPGTIADIEQRLRQAPALAPHTGMRTTARDMTTLLRSIWRDDAGPPEACQRVRFVMLRQVSRARIASGFEPSVRVAAKSGALLGLVRNEVGVVTFPSQQPYAVSVFTRTPAADADPRHLDAAIGTAAAIAVDALRS
jgi:beta-lactamase class A